MTGHSGEPFLKLNMVAGVNPAFLVLCQTSDFNAFSLCPGVPSILLTFFFPIHCWPHTSHFIELSSWFNLCMLNKLTEAKLLPQNWQMGFISSQQCQLELWSYHSITLFLL